MYGKMKRLNRLFEKESGTSIIVPMDHGATEGPIKGLTNMGEVISGFKKDVVNAVVLCKGQLNNPDIIQKCEVPIIVHLSNSSNLSPNPNFKTLVGTVEEAVALGADAISMHINMGDENEHTMLQDFGRISDSCYRWGMPLLAMMYVRGPRVVENVDSIKSAARLAQEMGADMVKLKYTGDCESFHEIVDATSIPVIAAGGETMGDVELLKTAYEIRKAGAAGISFGRNVFQNPNPVKITKELSDIIHKNIKVEDIVK